MNKSSPPTMIFAFLLILLALLSGLYSKASAQVPGQWASMSHQGPELELFTFVPVISGKVMPPVLNQIQNPELDNFYTVSWSQVPATSYVLEESRNTLFAPSTVVYQGSSNSWNVPAPGKTPSSYFYRVKSRLANGSESNWSNVSTVKINPLFVNLYLRWDGMGFIRTDVSFSVGTHFIRNHTSIVAPDIINSHNTAWYNPDPYGWGTTVWDSYFFVSTGEFHSSSVPPDPNWKWGYYEILPYDMAFQNGTIATINGVQFSVNGPLFGYTAFGTPVYYWQIINIEKFVFWEDGGSWKQYVNIGDAVLRYDAGRSRELLYSSVKRTFYYVGNQTIYYVHYVDNLSCSNGFIGGACTGDIPDRQPDRRGPDTPHHIASGSVDPGSLIHHWTR